MLMPGRSDVTDFPRALLFILCSSLSASWVEVSILFSQNVLMSSLSWTRAKFICNSATGAQTLKVTLLQHRHRWPVLCLSVRLVMNIKVLNWSLQINDISLIKKMRRTKWFKWKSEYLFVQWHHMSCTGWPLRNGWLSSTLWSFLALRCVWTLYPAAVWILFCTGANRRWSISLKNELLLLLKWT